MRIEPLPEPSVSSAALVAPAVTPIAAMLSLAWFPNIGTSGGYYVMAAPIVCVFALVLGYLGMVFVCLPFFLILSKAKWLSAPALCLLTSITGAALWAWIEADPKQPVLNSVVVGFLCSLSVSALFCYLAEIKLRPNGS